MIKINMIQPKFKGTFRQENGIDIHSEYIDFVRCHYFPKQVWFWIFDRKIQGEKNGSGIQ